MSAHQPEPRRSPLERSLAPQWLLRPSARFGSTAAGAELAIPPAPTPVRRPPRAWQSKQQLSPGSAAVSAWVGFLAAIALPIVAWHSQIASVASRFHLSLGYLVTGWSGYMLILCALVILLPVAVSAGRPPESRLRPRGRTALLSWGVVLYLLGLALASQVAALAG